MKTDIKHWKVITMSGTYNVTKDQHDQVRGAFDSDNPDPYIHFDTCDPVGRVFIQYEQIVGFAEHA